MPKKVPETHQSEFTKGIDSGSSCVFHANESLPPNPQEIGLLYGLLEGAQKSDAFSG